MKVFITAFLLPPGLALVLLILALYVWKKRALAQLMVVLALVCGWVMSTEAFGRFTSLFLVAQVQGPILQNPQDTDMIVVLTGGMEYVGEIGWLPTKESYRRAAVAYNLQNRIEKRLPVVMSGGRTHGLKYPSEAQVAQDAFARQQAAIQFTLLEENSTNTYESAMQVAAIARERRARNLFLVTSEVHMLRALAAYRGQGLDPVPFPVISVPRGPWELRDFLPSVRGVELTAKALYEFYGITRYLLNNQATWADLLYEKPRV